MVTLTGKKKMMIEALKLSLGVVSLACEQVKISRKTHYQWLKEDEIYKEAVSSIDDECLDFAESKLHELISKGNVVALLFFLKCKGKNRGYIERPENQINIQNNEAKYTLEIVKPNEVSMETEPEAV